MDDRMAPEADVALRTCVSLLRNFADVPFNPAVSDEEAMHNVARVNTALEEAGQRDAFAVVHLADMTDSERGRLVDHGMIDCTMIKNAAQAAVFLSKGATIDIGINGMEHVRINTALPGLQLERTADLAFTSDAWLDKLGAYAYDEQFGYLTNSPALAGAGMLVSVTLHLPILCATGQVRNLMHDIEKRGLRLERSFNPKNDRTGLHRLTASMKMGETEEEVLETHAEVAMKLVDAERAAREHMYKQDKIMMEDRLDRTLAVIGVARLMSVFEMRERCSDIRLAAALGMIDWPLSAIDRLFDDMSDASIECYVAEKLNEQPHDTSTGRLVTKKLNERQRDAVRAVVLREAVDRIKGTA